MEYLLGKKAKVICRVILSQETKGGLNENGYCGLYAFVFDIHGDFDGSGVVKDRVS